MDCDFHRESGNRTFSGAGSRRARRVCPSHPRSSSVWKLSQLKSCSQKAGESVQLQAIAVWSDGTREDVTCLTRFETHDNGVAEISAEGVVQATGQGDTYIVSFYDNGILFDPSRHAGQQTSWRSISTRGNSHQDRRVGGSPSCASWASCPRTCVATKLFCGESAWT